MSNIKSSEKKEVAAKRGKLSKLDAYNQGWEKVKKYMMSRDIPDWFRGTSKFQTSAANNLLEALLFDIEQHTYYRVKRCLSVLGLKPMISAKQIKVLMKLSQGNDLAFLWFLLEQHYQSKGPGYSVNEQLIMSTIAHLDMVTTLRELDRILPRNPPKPKIKPAIKERGITVKAINLNKNNIPKTLAPYYQTLRSPPAHRNKMTCKRPDLKIGMGDYAVWEDPNYIVRNEANRWFADYEPKAALRVVHNILREEINRIFDDYEAVAEKAQYGHIVCEYHKRCEESEDHLQTELEIIARERCKKYFDVEGLKKQRTRERIISQLQGDVDMIRSRLRNSTENRSTEGKNKRKKCIEVLVDNETIRYYEGKSSEDGCDCNENEYENENENEEGPSHSAKDKNDKTDDNSCESTSISEGDDCRKTYKHNSINFNELTNCELINRGLTIKGRPAVKVSTSAKKTTKCDMDMVTVSPSQQFFFASKEHQPWFFEFHKIFDLKHPFLPETLNVKQKCVDALDSEMSVTRKQNGNLKLEIDKALKKGFKRDWSKAVENYNLDNETPICPELMKKEQIERDGEEVPLKFDRDIFDPNDKVYMKYMLKRAFDFMRRKPKFVLAMLPDAHKLPCFYYFIQNRFGKTYSYEERKQLYLETLRILRALEKLTKTVPMPKIKKFSSTPLVSYACRDYLIEKGKKIRQQYYEELDHTIMEQARVFWFAVRPYLCSSGPPRNTFFAYMPSRSVDITRFRQWKSSEFMDAKKEWDRRERSKRS